MEATFTQELGLAQATSTVRRKL